MAGIELKGIAKAFGAEWVFRDFSLAVAPCECVCICGPSGCGKTTLLRMIAGLTLPDAGTIHIDGVLANAPALRLPPSARDIGMVFQDLALWPHLRVEQHLDLVLKHSLRDKVARRARIDEVLEACRIDHKRRAYPGELSGGQQQRVALARALAPAPRHLLLDEPFSNLDEEIRTHFLSEFSKIKADMTLIVAAHHPEPFADICSQTHRLNSQDN